MPRTKVVEFITNMGDGGAETLVKDYMLLLDREKIEVCAVICFDDADSANLRRLRERNISVSASNRALPHRKGRSDNLVDVESVQHPADGTDIEDGIDGADFVKMNFLFGDTVNFTFGIGNEVKGTDDLFFNGGIKFCVFDDADDIFEMTADPIFLRVKIDL